MIVLEQNSRDSMENVLLSVARAAQLGVDAYASNVDVLCVGFAFKRERFFQHADACCLENFHYISVNDPPEVVIDSALANEELLRKEFSHDPHGIQFLAQKRRSRNPFNLKHNYLDSIRHRVLSPLLEINSLSS